MQVYSQGRRASHRCFTATIFRNRLIRSSCIIYWCNFEKSVITHTCSQESNLRDLKFLESTWSKHQGNSGLSTNFSRRLQVRMSKLSSFLSSQKHSMSSTITANFVAGNILDSTAILRSMIGLKSWESSSDLALNSSYSWYPRELAASVSTFSQQTTSLSLTQIGIHKSIFKQWIVHTELAKKRRSMCIDWLPKDQLKRRSSNDRPLN